MTRAQRALIDALATARCVVDGAVSADQVLAVLELEAPIIAARMDSEVAVSEELNRLLARGCVRAVDGIGYEVDSEGLANDQSNRSRALKLVSVVAVEHDRPVQIAEILQVDILSSLRGGMSKSEVQQAVTSLLHTGEVISYAAVRGGSKKGTHFLGPPGMVLGLAWENRPKTWLEHVADACARVWAQRLLDAEDRNGLPIALTTGDVRSDLNQSGYEGHELDDPQLLVNAMVQLAQTSQPVLQKFKRLDFKGLAYSPAGWPLDQLEIGDAYGSDGERAVTAVQRAEDRFDRPVTVSEVQDEIDRDIALRAKGSQALFSTLSDLAKPKDGESKTRQAHHVGTVQGRAYWSSRDPAVGVIWTGIESVRLEHEALHAGVELASAQQCPIRSLAYGRLLLLRGDVSLLLDSIDSLRKETAEQVWPSLFAAACEQTEEDLREDLSEVQAAVLAYRDLADTLPAEPEQEITGWTWSQVQEILTPFDPAVEEVEEVYRLCPRFAPLLKRVPNPNFERRFDADPQTSAELLVEAVDLRFKIATRWGGVEAQLMANMSRAQLGPLRDVRFVLPALNSDDYAARMAGVGCLAFLQSSGTYDVLRRVACEDSDPGVRHSALWAYAASGASGAREFAAQRSKADPDADVRALATKLKICDAVEVWKM